MMLPRLRRLVSAAFLLTALGSMGCKSGREAPPPMTPRPATAVAFTDATAAAGLIDFRHDNGAAGRQYFPEQMGSGGGFVDYNGDGWPDIVLVGGGSLEPGTASPTEALRLYRNNRDGTFTEVTAEAGLSGIRAYGMGIVAADYDNDGDEDLFFTTLHRDFLFRNDGGSFISVGEQAGVSGEAAWSSSALFFDADRDGDLDLYVAHYAEWSPESDIYCSINGVVLMDTEGVKNIEQQYGRKIYCAPFLYPGIPGRFYQNQGDGSFTDASEQTGLNASPGRSLGVVEFDYNRDGWPDLVVANDAQPNLLFKNRGDGTFAEIGVPGGIAFDLAGNVRAGMGIDAGVVDGSGRESIFIGNFSNETLGAYTYAGNDQFTDRVSASGVAQSSLMTLTFGLVLFDVDNDGDLDLLAANGHVWPESPMNDGSTYRQAPQLYINQGQGVFSTATMPVLEQPLVARGASYADYDRDGDLDVLLTENGGPVHLWRNDLAGMSYLRVRLRGVSSNSEGLGAQLIASINGQRQYRRIRTGSSYLSQSEKVASFGLGGQSRVDTLLIYWPGGQLDTLLDLPVDQEIEVEEGAGRYQVVTPEARISP